MTSHLAAALPDSSLRIPFSLFEGDLVNRLFAVMGLRGRRIRDLGGRIIVLIFLTWVPLALLAWYGNVGMEQPSGQNFFFDIAAYAQFFIGLPLFVIAEHVVAARTREAAKHFVACGLVQTEDTEKIEGFNRTVERLRKAILPDVICILLAYVLVFVWIWPEMHNWTETWHAQGPINEQSLTAAGKWEVFVAVPLLNYWWLRWIWKIGLWCWYLSKLSKFKLTLAASHPDGTGGLGFLSDVQTKFGLVILAYGVSNIAATVAYKLAIEQTPVTVMAVWGPMVGFVILAPLIFTAPLFMFTKQLSRAKRRALELFNEKAMDRALAFQRKWLDACTSGEYRDLGGADLSGLDALNAIYDRIHKMRVVPLDARSLAELVGYAMGPFVPVITVMEKLQAPWLKGFIDKVFG
ncbi:MAG: hypothetical protein ACT4OO_15180 [Nitrospiraceae bacterium]